MIEESDIAMLAELNRLVTRYGRGSLTRLSELLRDPERSAELASALEAAAARLPQSKATSRSRRTDRFGMSVLNELRLTDPEKHAIIAEIRHHMITGETLETMAKLRNFAWENDLHIGRASSRNAAIAPLLRALSQLPLHEIASIRDLLLKADSDGGSLERLRDVIVKQSHRQESSEEST